MPKIYTKTGDKGTTSLYDSRKVRKSNDIFGILGSIDMLTSQIGILLSTNGDIMETRMLRTIQYTLQTINSIVATSVFNRENLRHITEKDISSLETQIDYFDSKNPKLTNFILPGVTKPDAQAHICRSQCRVAELEMWRYMDSKYDPDYPIPDLVIVYMNRLSDLFFVYARFLCYKSGNEDYIAKLV